MQVTPLRIPDVKRIQPQVFGDARGYFFESFSRRRFEEALGIDAEFVQDNRSRSRRGVLRGLHHQLPPKAQGKLVSVLEGEVFDVAVDLRAGSPTFGQWAGEIISAESKAQLWIPAGFAHGFLVLSETAEVFYKTTDYYDPKLDRSIRWNDPTIGIEWPLAGDPILAEKDIQAPLLKDAELP